MSVVEPGDEKTKSAESHELHPLVRTVLTDVRILMATIGTLIVTIFFGGFTAFGQVQSIARDAGAAVVVPVTLEVHAAKEAQDKHVLESAEVHRMQQAQIVAQGEQLKNVERVTFETNLNLRLLMERSGVKPINVVESTDGGHN